MMNIILPVVSVYLTFIWDVLKGHFVGRLYIVNVSLHVMYDGRPQQ